MHQEATEFDDDFDAGSGGSQSFDIWSYLSAARKFWWLIAIGIAAGLAAGFVLMKLTKQEYVSTAEIKVERRAESTGISLSGFRSPFDGAATQEDLRTFERSFASPALMLRVAKRLRAQETPGLTLHGFDFDKLDDGAVAGFLHAACTVSLVPDTRLLQISFRNPSPEWARRIAELIVEEGIQNEMDQRIEASSHSVRYLREEVQKFEDNLRSSEEKLNIYTRTLGNVSIDGEMNLEANRLRDLNSRATTVRAERLRLESELALLESRSGNFEELMKLETVQKSPSITGLSSQISETKGKIDRLSLRYREESPFMQQARSELTALEEALVAEVLATPNAVAASLAAARKSEEALQKEQEAQEEKVIQVRDLAVPSRVLQRQIDADRQAYEAALKRLTEELSYARNQPVLLQIVNPAGHAIPAGSKPGRLLGVALFVGAMLGFGGVFLITQMDTSVKTPEEAERLFRLPVIANVPRHVAPKDGLNEPAPHSLFSECCPVIGDAYSPAAEAFRNLRAALRVRFDPEDGNGILLGAVNEGDGSSFAATNLAVVLAQAGQRTLLVDANLRSPSIEKTIFDSRGRPGLADFLHGEAGLPSVIHTSPVPLLDVVPAGRPCPFPAETLSREHFSEFIKHASPLYDRIVVDSSPLGKFSDTFGFARMFPIFCLVLAAGKTPKSAARRALDQLGHSGGKASGLLFNDPPLPPHKHRRPFSLVAEDEVIEALPPLLECPACGKAYGTFPQFLGLTTGPVEPPAGVEADGRVFRRCSCGEVLGIAVPDLRDRTPAGERRRRIFGEILWQLQAAGLTPTEAREQLLLNLKVWRNETSGDSVGSSPAALERKRLLDELRELLVQAGQTPEEAADSLGEAIEIWRSDT